VLRSCVSSCGDDGRHDPPTEWWLASIPEGTRASRGESTREPISAASVSSATTSPLTVERPLALGVVGALARVARCPGVAAIGFVFNATVSTSERTGEFALCGR
jgi:hypothetical protein